METLFSWSSLLVMPFWGLMAFLPHARVTRWLTRGVLGPALPCLVYVALLVPHLGEVLPVVLRPEVGSVAALLATPSGATIAWVHFLAFDLFVGRWMYLDSRRRRLSAIAMAPILFFTLMLGPVGLLAYLGLRAGAAWWRRGVPVRASLERLWLTSPALVATAAVNGALLVGFALALAVDERVIMGELAWLKPAKFAASIVIYSATLVWMLSHVEGPRRAVRVIGQVIALTLLIEIIIIGVQAGRGTRSHFNVATALDSTLYSVMAVSIALATLAGVAALVVLFRQRFHDPTLGWAVRLGLLVSLIGASLGGVMTWPRAEQLERLARGQPSYAGAHAVGVEDGGAGLPAVGWSSEGGDLRVAHFVGLHAMQALPLLALWLARSRRARGLDSRQRARVFAGATVGYAGGFALLAWQALRGEPVTAPGTLTTMGLVVVVALAVSSRRRGSWRVGASRLSRRPSAPELTLAAAHP